MNPDEFLKAIEDRPLEDVVKATIEAAVDWLDTELGEAYSHATTTMATGEKAIEAARADMEAGRGSIEQVEAAGRFLEVADNALCNLGAKILQAAHDAQTTADEKDEEKEQ